MITREDKYIDPSSAKTYADNNAVQFKQACDFLTNYKEHLQSPLLDVGCGTGELTACIGKKFDLPITGGDISEARIKYADATYGSAQIKFVVVNAVKLDRQPDIANQLFGTVMSFNALHHVPKKDQLEAFQQIRKRLKPNGSALLLVPGRSPILHESLSETAESLCWKNYFSDFNIASIRTYEMDDYYKNLCLKAGFFRVHVTASPEQGGKEFTFEGMKKFLSGWIPHLAHLKEKILDEKLLESVKDQFLSDVVARYFQKMNKQLDETVSVTVTQNKIIAHAPASVKDEKLRSRL